MKARRLSRAWLVPGGATVARCTLALQPLDVFLALVCHLQQDFGGPRIGGVLGQKSTSGTRATHVHNRIIDDARRMFSAAWLFLGWAGLKAGGAGSQQAYAACNAIDVPPWEGSRAGRMKLYKSSVLRGLLSLRCGCGRAQLWLRTLPAG